MDSRLFTLINDYQASVRQAVELMVASGTERPTSNTEWAGLDIPQKGELNGGVRYYKHGYGCAVHLPNGGVDFDFGANGEIDGFDLWRLIAFSEGRLDQYGFSNEKEMKEVFDSSARSGELRFSGYLLYYLVGGNG